MNRKLVGWIVRLNINGHTVTLGRNGKTYGCAAGIEQFKIFKSIGGVRRSMNKRRIWVWEAIALYEGDELDRCGTITRAQ